MGPIASMKILLQIPQMVCNKEILLLAMRAHSISTIEIVRPGSSMQSLTRRTSRLGDMMLPPPVHSIACNDSMLSDSIRLGFGPGPAIENCGSFSAKHANGLPVDFLAKIRKCHGPAGESRKVKNPCHDCVIKEAKRDITFQKNERDARTRLYCELNHHQPRGRAAGSHQNYEAYDEDENGPLSSPRNAMNMHNSETEGRDALARRSDRHVDRSGHASGHTSARLGQLPRVGDQQRQFQRHTQEKNMPLSSKDTWTEFAARRSTNIAAKPASMMNNKAVSRSQAATPSSSVFADSAAPGHQIGAWPFQPANDPFSRLSHRPGIQAGSDSLNENNSGRRAAGYPDYSKTSASIESALRPERSNASEPKG